MDLNKIILRWNNILLKNVLIKYLNPLLKFLNASKNLSNQDFCSWHTKKSKKNISQTLHTKKKSFWSLRNQNSSILLIWPLRKKFHWILYQFDVMRIFFISQFLRCEDEPPTISLSLFASNVMIYMYVTRAAVRDHKFDLKLLN